MLAAGAEWEREWRGEGQARCGAAQRSAVPRCAVLTTLLCRHPPPCLPAVCGFVLERTGSFSPIFVATAALYVVGAGVWNVASRADPQFD